MAKLTIETAQGRESTRTEDWPQMDADQCRSAQAGAPSPHESDKAIALRWATAVPALPGELAGELGFQIEAVQGKYPDIEAKRQIQPGKWQRVRIEAEYESRNFALHGHDPAGCDIIVCWRHNWVKCPKEIEVIELSRVVRSRVIGTAYR